MYKPRPTTMTIGELKNVNEEAYAVVMVIVRDAARALYSASEATHKLGLEKCEETILELLEEGTAKIVMTEDEWDEDENRLWIGYFSPATGEYELPNFIAINNEEY